MMVERAQLSPMSSSSWRRRRTQTKSPPSVARMPMVARSRCTLPRRATPRCMMPFVRSSPTRRR
eukprot:4033868-Pyramimonas_sp.AAC.1